MNNYSTIVKNIKFDNFFYHNTMVFINQQCYNYKTQTLLNIKTSGHRKKLIQMVPKVITLGK